MYRIQQNVSWVGGGIFAATAALLAAIWFSHGPGWLLWGGIALPFVLYARYATNQFWEVDPASRTISKPRALFFRSTVPDKSIAVETEIKKDDHGAQYLLHVSGSFGTITRKLPDYEAYVTMLYTKMAGQLGLA
ncbi:hypothetical protein [Salidesulfovibrio brasiliensis]|uniref:hypothetical protein n=1 Tax=Salidesulfovibrio brasiliensis TaxID=221711 RepID=UPI0006D0D911|nr:hypothetical protein [Salidesulfovibrio brasiliensis]